MNDREYVVDKESAYMYMRIGMRRRANVKYFIWWLYDYLAFDFSMASFKINISSVKYKRAHKWMHSVLGIHQHKQKQ